ncbi:MAG: hypothetical protein OQK05_13755 [Pseudopelagicola sp.]|nr:hypothetical protein [Pseudopelagicola sp.]
MKLTVKTITSAKVSALGAIVSEGQDPIVERHRERDSLAQAKDAENPTFEDMAHSIFEARKAGLHDGGRRARWLM